MYIKEKIDLAESADQTIDKLQRFNKIMKKFKKHSRYNMEMGSIDSIFYNKFVAYSRTELKHQNNTLGRNIGLIKTVMNWGTPQYNNNNIDFKDFKVPTAPTSNVALTEEELIRLYNFDFSDNKKYDRVRDLFCFGAFTGLRFSDFSQIKRKNIHGDIISRIMKKTKARVEVPLNYYSKWILLKYDYNIPYFSVHYLNTTIKKVCKEVGIDDQISSVSYIGAKRTETTLLKYQKISSHTARRTFATIAMSKGLNPFAVMEITGHKDIKSFMKYVKITQNQTVKLMSDIFGAPDTSLKAI